MIGYIWPIVLVIVSNVLYHICTKSSPDMNPLASLIVTYLVGAAASAVLYFALNKDADLIRECSRLNWAPFALGIVIVGLEAGYIYAYKAGWQVSTASIVQGSFLAIALLLVGIVLYREPVSWQKVVGVVICLIGLAFINWN